MRITIITAALNPGPEVRQTIESVLTQSHRDVQYIFVDGGSNDTAFAQVEPYRDRFDVLIREPDAGISDAWNKGLALADGDVVGLISADDYLLPYALSTVAQVFSQHRDAKVVHGDALGIGRARARRLRPVSPLSMMIRVGTPVVHPATFVARSVYQAIGGFGCEYRIAMDYDLMLRAYLRGARFVHLDQPLVAVRAGGISDRDPLRGFREVRQSQLANGLNRPMVELLHAAKVGVRRYVRPLLGKA